LLIVDDVVPAVVAPRLGVADAFGVRAFVGGASVFAAGVYLAEEVSAFEPADDDPEAANEVDAPAPLAPDDALDWI
jgi:hypothetical protein